MRTVFSKAETEAGGEELAQATELGLPTLSASCHAASLEVKEREEKCRHGDPEIQRLCLKQKFVAEVQGC